MERNWVDFKAIKQVVPIEAALNRYGAKLKRSGKELRGRCPIHKGEGTDTFHANTDKNALLFFLQCERQRVGPRGGHRKL
jgi:DNA primase